MRTVKRFTQGLVVAGMVMGLALNAAAAPGGGPGKGPRGERQQARNINTHAVSAVREEITASAENEASAVNGEITASAVNGGRALAPRGFVPRFRSLKL